jgi:hypothetical protein
MTTNATFKTIREVFSYEDLELIDTALVEYEENNDSWSGVAAGALAWRLANLFGWEDLFDADMVEEKTT